MLSVEDAIARLRTPARVLVETESVALVNARGRVLAEDVEAQINVPGADNSAMDGYAMRRKDWPGPEQELTVSQRIPAGKRPEPLLAGTVARIFTGAIIPPGADAIVMQENVEVTASDKVRVTTPPRKGANIRPLGQDVRTGAKVLSRGTRIRPQELGQLASQGKLDVPCYRRLNVAVLSTGDELVEPGNPAEPWQIYNSNRFLIGSLLEAWGMQAVDFGMVADRPDAVKAVLMRAAEQTDVIVTSGGVSVGEEDHVRDVIEAIGNVDLWKVAIKPGKPFVFGEIGRTPLIGLPGNPVSVFVTLAILARPFLMRCQGMTEAVPEAYHMAANFERPAGTREEFLRVQRAQDGLVLHPSQSSGVLTSLCDSDGLARQCIGQEIRRGELLEFFPYEIMM